MSLGCYSLKANAKTQLQVDGNKYVPFDAFQRTRYFANIIRKIVCECAEKAKVKKAKFIAMHHVLKCVIVDEQDLEDRTSGQSYLTSADFSSFLSFSLVNLLRSRSVHNVERGQARPLLVYRGKKVVSQTTIPFFYFCHSELNQYSIVKGSIS